MEDRHVVQEPLKNVHQLSLAFAFRSHTGSRSRRTWTTHSQSQKVRGRNDDCNLILGDAHVLSEGRLNMTPKEARGLVGRRIVAVDAGGSWETDEYGGCRTHMHYPKITLDDGTVLRFRSEEHPCGAGEHGTYIVIKPPRGDSVA